MSNLVKHAKRELERANLFNEKGDFYEGHTGKAVMELIKCFAKQGHSGMSAPMVIDLFSKVANWKLASPIKNIEDFDFQDCGGDTQQSSVMPSVFKDDKGAYFLDAIVWKEESGGAFTGTVESITSRQYVKYPFMPKTFYIKVSSDRKILDTNELVDAFEYYDTDLNILI